MRNFSRYSATPAARCSRILALAAGLMSFLHTISGAATTWLETFEWSDKIKYYCDELAGLVDSADGEVHISAGFPRRSKLVAN